LYLGNRTTEIFTAVSSKDTDVTSSAISNFQNAPLIC